ncbi:MAG: DUF2846 domain-containing protein [Candidatus Sulfotelmatobacter sp.]|jgi:hypothetical protein
MMVSLSRSKRRFRVKYTSRLLLVLLWIGVVYGQDSSSAKPETAVAEKAPATDGQIPATRSETSGEKMAKIVVYREKAFKGKAIKPPVLYDGFLVTYLHNGSYVELLVPPGQHTVSSDKEGSRIFAGKRENSLIIDAKEGEASYVELKVVMGAWHGVGEVHQVLPETGKTSAASLARMEPDWARAGKTWLDGHTEPAAINVNGTWHGGDWGKLVLNQTEGSPALKGQCDKWDVNGVVSGNRVFLLFSSYGDVVYSAVLTAAGDKVLDGSFSKGLKAEDTKGKTMHLTKD